MSPMDWMWFKREVGLLALHDDALHVYGAFVVQMVAALLTKRSLGSILPWLAVLAVELLNEALDVLLGREPTIQPWQVEGAAHDLWNTMLLPTALFLLVRHAPDIFRSRAQEPRK